MPPPSPVPPPGGDALTVRDLTVSYGEAKVLFDIEMNIGPRQVVACVGRNGAGKTTLLKTIAGFLKPLAGSVTCGEVSLVGRPSYDIAKLGIKYVPQDKKVFSDLTVRENLELGSYATRDYDWGRVTDYFPKLKELMDRKAGFLSGGERQMLMIGRALLGSPRVLLIDEPTEGLAPPENRFRRIEQERGAGDRGTEPAAGVLDSEQGLRPEGGAHRGRARGP
jgi:ABC-type branched-subunit amino acid transport system ATPase component